MPQHTSTSKRAPTAAPAAPATNRNTSAAGGTDNASPAPQLVHTKITAEALKLLDPQPDLLAAARETIAAGGGIYSNNLGSGTSDDGPTTVMVNGKPRIVLSTSSTKVGMSAKDVKAEVRKLLASDCADGGGVCKVAGWGTSSAWSVGATAGSETEGDD